MNKIKKIIKFIWDEFIYGGHLQSLGASIIVFISGFLLNIKITFDCLLIIYLIVYIIYLYNRYKEIEIDYLTNPHRTEHIKRYIHYIPKFFYFLVFFIIISLIYFSNIWALYFGIFFLIFGWFYTLYFKKFTQKIFLFKNLFISLVFCLLPFFSIIYYSYSLTKNLLFIAILFAIFIFLKVFLMQIFFDNKDIQSDKKQGLKTLPVILEQQKLFNVLNIISILSIIPIIIGCYLNLFPMFFLIFLATIPFNFYCFYQAKKEKYCAYILESSEFILWFILIIIGKIII